MTLTTDAQARKNAPLYSGALAYFSKALDRLATYDSEADADGSAAESITRDLTVGRADEFLAQGLVYDKAGSIAANALDLLQEELTGVPVTYPYRAAGLHSFLARYADALMYVAEVSRKGSEQHNPGKPLFWDRSKSGDELDALARHLLEAGTLDSDGVRHSGKVCWRALANLEKSIEQEHAPASWSEVGRVLTSHGRAEAMRKGVPGTVENARPAGSVTVTPGPVLFTFGLTEDGHVSITAHADHVDSDWWHPDRAHMFDGTCGLEYDPAVGEAARAYWEYHSPNAPRNKRPAPGATALDGGQTVEED